MRKVKPTKNELRSCPYNGRMREFTRAWNPVTCCIESVARFLCIPESLNVSRKKAGKTVISQSPTQDGRRSLTDQLR